MRLAKALTVVVILISLTGMSVTGYALANLPTLLSPIDQTAQVLSSVSLPVSIKVNLTGSSQAVRAVASSFPDCVTVSLFGCVFDLTRTKAGLNQLANSLVNIQVDTGLGNVQTEIQQTGQGLLQVKVFVTILIAFFFATSALFFIIGVILLLLSREIRKVERRPS